MPRRKYKAYMDDQIVRLNSVGLSLTSISKLLNCHPSTVTLRLKSMGITPLDSRKSFMEDILAAMTNDQQEWIVDVLESKQSNIKDYITELLAKEYKHNATDSQNQRVV